MDNIKEFTATLKLDKVTKNKVRYAEGEEGVFGTVYIPKSVFKTAPAKDGFPESITLKMSYEVK